MIINQTRIETPKQATFVPNGSSTNPIPFISYIRKEKSKNVIVLSSDEEDSGDEQVSQPQLQPQPKLSDQQNQPIANFTSSTRPHKQRKIEGSQNDPISLDDSDDDMAEITENIKPVHGQKEPFFDTVQTQPIISSLGSSPMSQFEDSFGDNGPPIDQETFRQNFFNLGELGQKTAEEEKQVSKDEKCQDGQEKRDIEELQNGIKNDSMEIDSQAIVYDDDDDESSVLSELSEMAYDQLSRMSVHEDGMKEEDGLADAMNIARPVSTEISKHTTLN